MDRPKDDLSLQCRLCSSQCKLISLFRGKNKEVRNFIRKLVQVAVGIEYEEDNYFDCICVNCVIYTFNVHVFRTKSLKNEEKLQILAQNRPHHPNKAASKPLKDIELIELEMLKRQISEWLTYKHEFGSSGDSERSYNSMGKISSEGFENTKTNIQAIEDFKRSKLLAMVDAIVQTESPKLFNVSIQTITILQSNVKTQTESETRSIFTQYELAEETEITSMNEGMHNNSGNINTFIRTEKYSCSSCDNLDLDEKDKCVHIKPKNNNLNILETSRNDDLTGLEQNVIDELSGLDKSKAAIGLEFTLNKAVVEQSPTNLNNNISSGALKRKRGVARLSEGEGESQTQKLHKPLFDDCQSIIANLNKTVSNKILKSKRCEASLNKKKIESQKRNLQKSLAMDCESTIANVNKTISKDTLITKQNIGSLNEGRGKSQTKNFQKRGRGTSPTKNLQKPLGTDCQLTIVNLNKTNASEPLIDHKRDSPGSKRGRGRSPTKNLQKSRGTGFQSTIANLNKINTGDPLIHKKRDSSGPKKVRETSPTKNLQKPLGTDCQSTIANLNKTNASEPLIDQKRDSPGSKRGRGTSPTKNLQKPRGTGFQSTIPNLNKINAGDPLIDKKRDSSGSKKVIRETSPTKTLQKPLGTDCQSTIANLNKTNASEPLIDQKRDSPGSKRGRGTSPTKNLQKPLGTDCQSTIANLNKTNASEPLFDQKRDSPGSKRGRGRSPTKNLQKPRGTGFQSTIANVNKINTGDPLIDKKRDSSGPKKVRETSPTKTLQKPLGTDCQSSISNLNKTNAGEPLSDQKRDSSGSKRGRGTSPTKNLQKPLATTDCQSTITSLNKPISNETLISKTDSARLKERGTSQSDNLQNSLAADCQSTAAGLNNETTSKILNDCEVKRQTKDFQKLLPAEATSSEILTRNDVFSLNEVEVKSLTIQEFREPLAVDCQASVTDFVKMEYFSPQMQSLTNISIDIKASPTSMIPYSSPRSSKLVTLSSKVDVSICQECDKILYTKRERITHRISHMRCRLCKKKFTSMKKTKEHHLECLRERNAYVYLERMDYSTELTETYPCIKTIPNFNKKKLTNGPSNDGGKSESKKKRKK